MPSFEVNSTKLSDFCLCGTKVGWTVEGGTKTGRVIIENIWDNTTRVTSILSLTIVNSIIQTEDKPNQVQDQERVEYVKAKMDFSLTEENNI